MTASALIVGALVLVAAAPLGPAMRLATLNRPRPTGLRRSPPNLDVAAITATGFAVWVLAGLASVAVLALLGATLSLTRRRVRRKRDELAVERGLVDTVDHLSLLVAAGMPIRAAITAARPHCPQPQRAALGRVDQRLARGAALGETLLAMVDELGPAMRPLVTSVLAAERDGDALGPALDRVAEHAHHLRRVRAEESARRLPVLLLLPLVLCVLPAFALLTVVPLLAGSLRGLSLPS